MQSGRTSHALGKLLADLIVVFHAAYVSFVVFGLVAILLGIAFRWGWVRNFWFRSLHLSRSGSWSLEALVGITCPLTVWEAQLRKMAGQAAYARRLHRPLGHQLIFFRCRALGLHLDLYPVRPGGPGGVHPGTAAPIAWSGRLPGRIGERSPVWPSNA